MRVDYWTERLSSIGGLVVPLYIFHRKSEYCLNQEPFTPLIHVGPESNVNVLIIPSTASRTVEYSYVKQRNPKIIATFTVTRTMVTSNDSETPKLTVLCRRNSVSTVLSVLP